MLLIVTLGQKLNCWLTSGPIDKEFLIDSERYRDVGHGDWSGFYDFLRTNEGKIIGVRYAPLVEDSDLVAALKHKPYAELLSNGAIELYFSTERLFVAELSADQNFGDNMILRSASSNYALTFGLDDLELSDRTHLADFGRCL